MKKIILGFLLTTTAFAQSLRSNVDQQFLNALAPGNYIINSSAEDNDLNVTDASSIHTRTTTLPLAGFGSHAIDATAGSQLVVFVGTALQLGIRGQNCEARFSYNGDASLYTAYATLNGVTVSAVQTLQNIASGSQAVSLNFPCGVSSTDVASVVIASTGNGAAIKVDSVYVGEATNIGSVAQARFVGAASYATTASCDWARTNTVLGAFTSTAACPSPTVQTNPGPEVISTADNNLPQVTLSNLVPGTYSITVTGAVVGSVANVSNLSVFDGTSYSGMATGVQVSGGIVGFTIQSSFTYTSAQSSVTFSVHGSASSGTVTINNQNASNQLGFEIKRYPTSSEQVFSVSSPGISATSWTPTFSAGLGTVTNVDMQYQCLAASKVFASGRFTSGTTAGSIATLTLPTGFTNTTNAQGNRVVGRWYYNTAGTSTQKAGSLLQISGANTIQLTGDDYTTGTSPLATSTNANQLFATGVVSVYFTVDVTSGSPCPATPLAAISLPIAPTIQKFTTGSGTYTTPAGVRYIRVRMVGGGGGGGGSAGGGATNGGNGTAGGNTTFGSSLLEANGGGLGQGNGQAGGTGGTASLGTGPIGTSLQGGDGSNGAITAVASVTTAGGHGGVSAFGGNGFGGLADTGVGRAAKANTGSGGGGASSAQSSASLNRGGGGGGAGGFIDAFISSPSLSYSYAVGAAGAGGTAGTSGAAGGAGSLGYIEVTEYYY